MTFDRCWRRLNRWSPIGQELQLAPLGKPVGRFEWDQRGMEPNAERRRLWESHGPSPKWGLLRTGRPKSDDFGSTVGWGGPNLLKLRLAPREGLLLADWCTFGRKFRIGKTTKIGKSFWGLGFLGIKKLLVGQIFWNWAWHLGKAFCLQGDVLLVGKIEQENPEKSKSRFGVFFGYKKSSGGPNLFKLRLAPREGLLLASCYVKDYQKVILFFS